MELHRIVQEARRREGLTQEELAERTGITVRTIQRIESGETTPRAFTLKTIAEVLGLSLSDLQPPASPAPPDEPSPPAASVPAAPGDGNTHFLRFVCLSCFSCLLLPMVHFLVPLFIYRSRASLLSAEEKRFARRVVFGQIYWVIALDLLLLLTLAWNLWQGREGWQISYITTTLLLYAANAILIFWMTRQAGRLEVPRK
ncbi:XRE family transcriptional regulator [Flaviaesturariibacter flavus]|uniref:XRE family transcriptional regulator n=1 Tax=Flaviaesturariibacter flavus TaxID=2502780 RepID=A0A4R1B8E7_9BACT|nr:helix-turn-helix transcriptional regulator [Flaviaesturariibacter flavus]TCJ13268.1 XRE family transcriptional regulator [Flaviaesturariibacter flavus]